MNDSIHKQNRRLKPGQPRESDAMELEIHKRFSIGERQVDLAKEFGVSQSAISKIVSRVENRLRPVLMEQIRNQKVPATIALRHTVREALHAWGKSKQDTVTAITKPDGTKETTKASQSGNPAFLAQAMAALDRILMIWGADKPQKNQGESEYRFAGKSREQVARERIAQLQIYLESET